MNRYGSGFSRAAIAALASLTFLTGPALSNDRVVSTGELPRAVERTVNEAEHWCATGDATLAEQQALSARAAVRSARSRIGAQAVLSVPRLENGVYGIGSDDLVAPFLKPVDLAGTSINFTPAGTGFDVQKGGLVWAEPAGCTSVRLSAATPHHPFRLTFDFPFLGNSQRDLYISATKGIYFSAPASSTLRQYGFIDAVNQRVPLIAPLLHAALPASPLSSPTVSICEVAGSSVTITWKSTGLVAEEIQARLDSSGAIRFSYKTVPSWGAVIVTSGREPFYDKKSALFGDLSDATGDVIASAPAEYKDRLDIRTISAHRIDNSELIEFRLKVGAPIDRQSLPKGVVLYYYIELGTTMDERVANRLYLELDSSRIFYAPAAWAGADSSPAVTVEGDTISLRVTEDLLSLPAGSVRVNVFTAANPGTGYLWTDTFVTPVSWSAATTRVQSDLSEFDSRSNISARPIIEVFNLPILNVEEIWKRIKASYNLTDADVDGVAIYQTFFTDIVAYASGYSTGGNPGVDGIGSGFGGSGTTTPRRPALLHMNKLGYGWNATPNGRMLMLTHEFGHRWLYRLRIMENGVATRSLNPDSGHPKRGVHMPAAFNVITSTDSSAMGGGHFTRMGTDVYRTPEQGTHIGYSWHELYLLGLAAASEVEPWFYLKGEGLEAPYYPLSNTTFSGVTRTDVVQQQIIGAMGVRTPSYGSSQTQFRFLHVVVDHPTAPATAATIGQVLNEYARPFESHFKAITGNRGTLVPTQPVPPRTRVKRGK